MRLYKIGFIFSLMCMMLLSNVTYASTTVTLTGSCPISVVSAAANTLNFTLQNSGNSAAQNLEILPSLGGVHTMNNEFISSDFTPGNEVFTFNLDNFSDIPGTYVGLFNVKYKQTGSVIFSTFPCIYYVNSGSISNISITNVSLTKTGTYSGISRVHVINFGRRSVNATVYPFGPLNFNITPSSYNVTIKPGSIANLTFSVKSLPTASLTNSSFVIGFYAYYITNGVHYSTFPDDIFFLESVNQNALGIGVYAIIAVIIVIVILIILSLFIRKRRRGRTKSGK